MSSIIYLPQVDVYSKKQNLLNAGLSEKLEHSAHNQKSDKKTFSNLSEFEQCTT